MNIPYCLPKETCKSILKKYQELPYVEKRILQLLTLSKADIAKTNFLGVINDSDLKVSLDKQYMKYWKISR